MIRKLEWDSSYWNIEIADCIYENDYEIKEYLSKKHVDMVQAQVNINKAEDIRKLENLNFRFIDLNVTYNVDLDSIEKTTENYCIANEKDICGIEKIARQVFKDSRYNAVNVEKTKEFYELWAEKAVRGEFDDVCLVEKDERDGIKGFVTVKKTGERSARIGLIGVDPVCQNKSVGTSLINQTKNYLLDEGVERLFVSTQGSNISAQNFYAKNGFKVCDVSVWMYLLLSEQ